MARVKRSTRRKQRKAQLRQIEQNRIKNEEREKNLKYALSIGYDPNLDGKIRGINVNEFIESYEKYIEKQYEELHPELYEF